MICSLNRSARAAVAKHAGFSLIQLMVSLFLGLLLIGVATDTFLSVKSGATGTRGASTIAGTTQAASAYLRAQLARSGYVDLFADASRPAVLSLADQFGAGLANGNGTLLSAVYATSYTGLMSLHGCDGGYTTRQELLNYACSTSTSPAASSFTVAFQALTTTTGWEVASLKTGLFQTDCGARSPRGTSGATTPNPPGDVVLNRFYLDSGRLMCIGNGDPGTPIRIADDIEQFQVLYGLPASTTDATTNYVTAASVGASAWGTVTSVQVCMLVRGEPNSGVIDLGGVSNALDCTGVRLKADDGRLRYVHRFVVNLRNATTSAVALP